jgi:hypothetical protein
MHYIVKPPWSIISIGEFYNEISMLAVVPSPTCPEFRELAEPVVSAKMRATSAAAAELRPAR